MKHIVITILFLYAFLVRAQPPDRFIGQYYPSPNLNSESYGVVETSYGYMISGLIYDTLVGQGYWAFAIKGIDFYGAELWQKKMGNPSCYFYSGWYVPEHLKKIGSHYYSVADIYKGNVNQIGGGLIKLNEVGDTIWLKEYPSDTDSIQTLHSVAGTMDGGFILTGSTWSNSIGNEKVILIKTDSLGNVEWKKKFDYSSSYERGNDVIQDPISKKYLIIGYRGNPSKGFLYSTDSLGNLIFQTNIGGGYASNFGNIKTSSDGNYFICGAYGTGNTFGGWDLGKSYLLKIDIGGNVIWSKLYGDEQLINDFGNIITLPGDTLIVAGQVDTFYTNALGLNSMYQVYKIAPNGDSIWKRYIDIIPTNGTQDIFKAIIPTSDGGFALTGFFYDSAPNPFVLVKLDEWGCDTLNCHMVGLSEIDNDVVLNISPNPANENLFLNVESQTPTKVAFFEIINSRGELMVKDNINSNLKEINTQNYSPGAYLIRIVINDKFFTSKVFIITH